MPMIAHGVVMREWGFLKGQKRKKALRGLVGFKYRFEFHGGVAGLCMLQVAHERVQRSRESERILRHAAVYLNTIMAVRTDYLTDWAEVRRSAQ